MRGPQRSEGGAFWAALLGFAWTSACAGLSTYSASGTKDLADAAAPSGGGGQAPDAAAPVSDASPAGCPACTDATADEQSARAQDAGDQDSDDGSAPDQGICHVTWPQSRYDYYLDGTDMQMADFYLLASPIQLAVDSAGDAYLAVSYSTQDLNPAITLDLGVVASPSYQVGVAIAKVDASCNLLWVREIGGPLALNVANTAVAVDANSNVTVLGAFKGTIDVGGTTLSTPGPSSPTGNVSELYLARFDAKGTVVFATVVPSDGSQYVDVGSLVVSSGGTSTLVVDTWLGAQFTQYALQFDPAGAVVFQSPGSATGPFVNQMAADSSGTLWALGSGAIDAGIPNTGPPLVMQLTSTGSVAWSQPTLYYDNNSTLFAAGKGGALVFTPSFPSSPYGNGKMATETIQAYSPGGTSPWTQATDVSYGQLAFAEQMVVDDGGDAIVAGDFSGSEETSADGSTIEVATPTGMGFQVFDSTGHFVSMKTWAVGGPDPEQFGAVALDPQGNVLLAGTTQRQGHYATGTTSVFLVKLAR